MGLPVLPERENMNPRAIDVGILLGVALFAVLGYIVVFDDAHSYGWLEITGCTAITIVVCMIAAHSLDNLLRD